MSLLSLEFYQSNSKLSKKCTSMQDAIPLRARLACLLRGKCGLWLAAWPSAWDTRRIFYPSIVSDSLRFRRRRFDLCLSHQHVWAEHPARQDAMEPV
ncbi:MAG: hypothetical protein GY941_13615 [Planctomycetes bacterium]|nr:hypothetical protein [Planctomycetota bacterium]